jgi:hypothetical protein
MTEPDHQRTLRRRHKHERQAVIFGVLLAVLAAAGLLSAAIMSGTIDAPFARGFTEPKHKPTETRPKFPCPAPDAVALTYKSVAVNVLNSTDRSGLAATVGAELTARGFVVKATDNSPLAVPGTARIVFGAQGIAAGYTLAAQVDSPQLVMDGRADATVDLIVGDTYDSLLDPTAVTLEPTVPLVPRPGCVPLSQIVATAAPTSTGTPAG